MESAPYPTYNPASNASHIHPMSYHQFPVPSQQQQLPYFPFMPLPQMQTQPQLPMQYHGFPVYPTIPTHHFPLIPVRQPFLPMNQFYPAPSPQCAAPQQVYPNVPPSTPTTSRPIMHNMSLNASLGATSFNDSSIRYNPMAGRPSRNHSLVFDQTTDSKDRSFQPTVIDPTEMAYNNELIAYCFTELCRKQLTEQELVIKVSKSRRFKKFGKDNIPKALSIILNTWACFIPRTFIVKTSPNDLQPISKTVWKADTQRYQRPRGNNLNATMFEIKERSSGEVLSVLGDIASLNLDENKPPTSIASMERIMDGFKV